MKRQLFFPFLINKSSYVEGRKGPHLIPDEGKAMPVYYTIEEAVIAGQALALQDPEGQVVIFTATKVIEPKKVEFTEKTFNKGGELIV